MFELLVCGEVVPVSRRVKVLILLLSVLLVVALVLAPGMGYFLVVGDETGEADVVMVLMGSIPDRVLEAADIYLEGKAGEVLIVQSFSEASAPLAARGAVLPGQAELARDVLVQLGVPGEVITVLPGQAQSTRDEALIFREYLEDNPQVNRVMLVTSSFHSRRSRAIFERFCGGLDGTVSFTSRPSSYDSFQPERWWTDRESAKRIFMEYTKLAHFYIIERW